MSIEPGWYYAEGDPAGTLRRWNGTEWIGFPIPQPGSQPAHAEAVITHTQGQVSLKVPAILTQIALILMALLSIAVAVSYFRLAGDPGGLEEINDSLATQFGLAYILALLAGLAAAIIFVIWFYMAYRNISLWTRTRRSPIWTIFAWIVPFMNMVRPMSMMLELVEHSPLPNRRGRLSPTPVIVWWFMWILPGALGALLIINTALRAEDAESLTTTVLVIQGVITIANVISMLLAVYIVQGITDEQEHRRG